jgi:GAF domain-containing protein
MGLLRSKRKDDVDVASCLANLHRLEAVRRSGLIERGRDVALDHLAASAAAELRTPMAFLNVLDDTWEHRVAAHGAAGPRQQPVERSYCQYVVAHDDVVVITDATADPLVRDHPATAEGVRAYLGVPIRRDGRCLGSFCVVDDHPRDWTEEDLAALRGYARRATAFA